MGESGFSMIESLIFIAVLTVAALGLSASIVRSMVLSEATREHALAAQAARDALEDLRSFDFGDVFARFNDVTSDDPVTGPSPGNTFVVTALNVSPNDPDGIVGEYVFPQGATPGVLTENPNNAFGGMTRDLNLDGDTSDADVTSDHQVLPVMVRLKWRGAAGDRQLELSTMLVGGP